MNTAILAGIVCALLGWFLNNLYQGINDKINGKIDKGCHEICTKEKEKMNTLLLEEIRGLRGDFKTKSEIVVNAVTGRDK